MTHPVSIAKFPSVAASKLLNAHCTLILQTANCIPHTAYRIQLNIHITLHTSMFTNHCAAQVSAHCTQDNKDLITLNAYYWKVYLVVPGQTEGGAALASDTTVGVVQAVHLQVPGWVGDVLHSTEFM